MTDYAVRVTLFTILPVAMALLIGALDSTVDGRVRKLELYLIYLFGLGVTGSGIGGALGHLFLSDAVAQSVGWPTGSPFQLEMGFTNLALGVLGLVAVSRRDGFREATVMAVTVVGVGATIVHLWDIAATGNLAPGNTIQNVANLAKPILLIGLLRASRRAGGESAIDSAWLQRQGTAVGLMTGVVSTGFGVGYATGHPVIGAVLGVLAGAAGVWMVLSRGSRPRVAPAP